MFVTLSEPSPKGNKTDKHKNSSNKSDESIEKNKWNQNNKTAHTTNGNRNAYKHKKFLQLNSSNLDFWTKSIILRATIDQNKSDVVFISDANSEINNA